MCLFLFYSQTNWLYYSYSDLLSSWGSVVLLATFAGAVSFFSPCAFPLLLGFVTYYLSLEKHESTVKNNSVQRAISLGLLLAFGTLALYVLIGSAVTLLITFLVSQTTAYSYVALMQPLVGLLFMLFGLTLFTNRSFGSPFLNTLTDKIVGDKMSRANNPGKGPMRGVLFYGLGYGAATGGCTAPIFLSLMVYSSTYGGIASAGLAFLIYSVMMFASMTGVAVLAALSKDALLNRLRASTMGLKRISGVVLIIVGLYLVYVYIGWVWLGNMPKM
ncbi:MAG: cytochrome c biogenesis CcdA family protein [Candidatus Bathyarchaeia archaeon]